jgi:hypothetical protein
VDQNVMGTLRNLGQSMLEHIQVTSWLMFVLWFLSTDLSTFKDGAFKTVQSEYVKTWNKSTIYCGILVSYMDRFISVWALYVVC